MRIITSLVFLVIILFPAFGQSEESSRSYGFSLGLQTGFVYGQAFELVYPVSGNTKGELLSELRWDMKPIFYLGIKADFGKIDVMSSPGFFASASIKAGIPADSGIMEDRDWMSIENDALTHFSSHTNRTKEMYMADLLLGASFPVKSAFYIKPFLCGSWMRFSFSGRNGYLQHAKGDYGIYTPNDEVQKQYVSGVVITYKQDWFIFSTGLSAGTHILYPFTIDLSFRISPLTYCAATDEHMLPDEIINEKIIYGKSKITFKDYTNFGFYIEPEVNVSFCIKQFELSLICTYKYIGRTNGETYIKGDKDTQFYLSSSKAGAGLSILDTRLLLSTHF